MAIEYRSPTPADWPAISAAFPEGWTEAHHGWFATGNPAGCAALAAFDGGELVAHAALASRFVVVQGKERRFGTLTALLETRPGQLAVIVRGLLDEHLGPKACIAVTTSPRGPGQRVLEKLLARMLGFEVLHTRTDLLRELPAEPTAPEEIPGLVAIERFDEQARWLHDRCAGAWLALPLHDDAFLNWRFLDRPGSRCEAFGVRDGEGILRGLGVLGAPDGQNEVRLLAWLVPPEEPDVGAWLLAGLERAAARRGARRLRVLLPPSSPWFAAFQERAYRATASPRLLLARSSSRRLDDLALRDGLYITEGEDPLAD